MYSKEYIQKQLKQIEELEDTVKYLRGELEIEKENALLLYEENQMLKDKLFNKLNGF